MKTLSHIRTRTNISQSFYLSWILFNLSLIVLYFIVRSTNVYGAQVTLVWDYNNKQEISGYNVYYGNSSRNYFKSVNIASSDITTCTITDLIEGQTYYFAATAYNDNFLESNYSTEVSYTIESATTSVPPTTTTTNPAVACQQIFGDLDSDGMVTIGEVVAAERMYSGLDPVNSLVDLDNDGVVQIWDLMKVINCYRETQYCLCLDDLVAP
jgi:hypothetical protein